MRYFLSLQDCKQLLVWYANRAQIDQWALLKSRSIFKTTLHIHETKTLSDDPGILNLQSARIVFVLVVFECYKQKYLCWSSVLEFNPFLSIFLSLFPIPMHFVDIRLSQRKKD